MYDGKKPDQIGVIWWAHNAFSTDVMLMESYISGVFGASFTVYHNQKKKKEEK